jgi:hypothetical protein
VDGSAYSIRHADLYGGSMLHFFQMTFLLGAISLLLGASNTSAQGILKPIVFAQHVGDEIVAIEFDAVQVPILSYRARLNRVWIETGANPISSEVNVSFNFDSSQLDFPTPQQPQLERFLLPGLPPGNYSLRLIDSAGKTGDQRRLRVTAAQAKQSIDTYTINAARFVLAGSIAEAASLFGDGPVEETGSKFLAWPVGGVSPTTAKPVTRLKYQSGVVTTYFFTLLDRDVATLSSLPGWTNEGPVFKLIAPEAGVCPFATQPIYRSFNQLADDIRPTHRYTPNVAAYTDWIATHRWSGEGVAFCAPLS